MMNASLRPNFAADTSRMSLSVSTLLPFSSAHERAQRPSGAFPVRRVVREQDGLHVKVREPGDRFAGLGHVVGEEIVRERDLSLTRCKRSPTITNLLSAEYRQMLPGVCPGV